jgi:DNA polymerase-3 subunit delta'
MKWDEIIGHQSQQARLKRLIVRQSVPHAFLFSGPAGIGKRQVARAFAQTLLCDRQESDPCQVCQSCKVYLAGNHPDFIELVPDGASMKIDQIRLLQKEASFTPQFNQGRVFVIDDAEKMTPQAQNSLLKLLEEPPVRFVFILIVSSRQSVLETIFSRCQEVRFDLVSIAEVTAALLQAGWPQEQAGIAAKISQGKIAPAIAFLEAAGLSIRQQALDWLTQLSDLRASAVLDHADQLLEFTPQVRAEFFYHSKLLLRDLLLSRLCQGETWGQLAVNTDKQVAIESMGRYWEEQQVTAALLLFAKAEQSLKQNGNPRITLEYLALSLRDLTNGRETSANSCGYPL